MSLVSMSEVLILARRGGKWSLSVASAIYEAAVSDFKNFLEIFLGSIEFGY